MRQKTKRELRLAEAKKAGDAIRRGASVPRPGADVATCDVGLALEETGHIAGVSAATEVISPDDARLSRTDALDGGNVHLAGLSHLLQQALKLQLSIEALLLIEAGNSGVAARGLNVVGAVSMSADTTSDPLQQARQSLLRHDAVGNEDLHAALAQAQNERDEARAQLVDADLRLKDTAVRVGLLEEQIRLEVEIGQGARTAEIDKLTGVINEAHAENARLHEQLKTLVASQETAGAEYAAQRSVLTASQEVAEKRIAGADIYVDLLKEQVRLEAVEISRLAAVEATAAERGLALKAAEDTILHLRKQLGDAVAGQDTSSREHAARLKKLESELAKTSRSLSAAEQRHKDLLTKHELAGNQLEKTNIYVDLLKEQVRLEAVEISRLVAVEATAVERGLALKAAEDTILDLRKQLGDAVAGQDKSSREHAVRLKELEFELANTSRSLSAAEQRHTDLLGKLALAEKRMDKTNVYVDLLKEQVRLEGMEISRLVTVEVTAAEQGVALASANDDIQKLRASYVLGDISREPILLQGLYETVEYPGMPAGDLQDTRSAAG